MKNCNSNAGGWVFKRICAHRRGANLYACKVSSKSASDRMRSFQIFFKVLLTFLENLFKNLIPRAIVLISLRTNIYSRLKFLLFISLQNLDLTGKITWESSNFWIRKALLVVTGHAWCFLSFHIKCSLPNVQFIHRRLLFNRSATGI